MIHEIYFGDISGRTMGVWLTGVPPIVSAPERGDYVEIAGRDGKQFVSDNALDTQTVSLELYIEPGADINAICSWIYSADTMRVSPYNWEYHIDANETKLSLAEWEDFVNEGWTTKLTVTVQPYRYQYPATGEITVSNGGSIVNRCFSASAPVITITGSGDGDIAVSFGQYTIDVTSFKGTIVLDCESMTALNADGTASMAGYVTFGAAAESDGRTRRWPMLDVGANAISWTGTATVKVLPRWRNR